MKDVLYAVLFIGGLYQGMLAVWCLIPTWVGFNVYEKLKREILK
jgi:hypothetical protein